MHIFQNIILIQHHPVKNYVDINGLFQDQQNFDEVAKSDCCRGIRTGVTEPVRRESQKTAGRSEWCRGIRTGVTEPTRRKIVLAWYNRCFGSLRYQQGLGWLPFIPAQILSKI